MPYLSALILLIFAFPEPRMNWVDKLTGAVRIEVPGDQELLSRCIESGLQLRFRFQFRLCRKRTGWLDGCGDDVKEVHTMQFDPASESYRVEIDRFGDADDPVATTVAGLVEARKMVAAVPDLALDDLGGDSKSLKPRSYIGVRVVADCKGGLDSMMLELSNIVTFGLVRIDRFDSGWVAFELNE